MKPTGSASRRGRPDRRRRGTAARGDGRENAKVAARLLDAVQVGGAPVVCGVVGAVGGFNGLGRHRVHVFGWGGL